MALRERLASGSDIALEQMPNNAMDEEPERVGPGNGRMKALFDPFHIRGLYLKNRFVLPAMSRGWAVDRAPGERMTAYYERCAKGGTAMIIAGSNAVDHPSATSQPLVTMVTPATAAAWRRTIAKVREAGSSILLQLWHEGAIRKEGRGGPHPDAPTLSPSGLVKKGTANGRAATLSELSELIESYVRAARIAEEVGASGIELHCAHGYLLDQFLWHETNIRQDRYGGDDIVDRACFPVEIVAAIRSVVSSDFVISVRLSQWKEVDYEARIAETPDDLRRLLAVFRVVGADIFHMSARRFYKPEWSGSDLGIAGWAKSLTDAAVIAVGSVGLTTDVMDMFFTDKPVKLDIDRTLDQLSSRMQNGEFDLVAVGRAVVADQEWVAKIREGRLSEIAAFDRSMLQSMVENWDTGLIGDEHK